MSRPPTLLLIRGLGHSGTTILDLALGAHRVGDVDVGAELGALEEEPRRVRA